MMYDFLVRKALARKTVLAVIIALLLSSILFVCNTKQAEAFVSLRPDPGDNIPAELRAYLQNCDTYGSSPAYVQWIGSQIGPQSVAIVNVPYGQQFVDVRWYISGTVCYSNSAVYAARYHLVGGSSGTSWWSNATLNFQNCGYNSVGCFQAAAIDVRYTHFVPFTETGNIGIDLYASGINQFTDGLYGCVGGPNGNKGSLDNYSGCFFTNPTFNITIIVDPPIRGCMDQNAVNFNRDAQQDDGSCQYPPTVTITAVCTTQNSFTNARLTTFVNASDRNNNIASVVGSAGGQTIGIWETVLNVPYSSSGTATVTVQDTTNLSATASANYSCPRAPIPGCMDPAAANYNPLAELDDGTCIYDFCLNISGVQPAVPVGLFRSGSNCYFPAPTCSAGPPITGYTGDSFQVSVTINNSSAATLDLTRVSYTGPQSVNGTTNYGDSDIGGNGQRTESATHNLDYPEPNSQVVWTISYRQPYGLGDGSIVCRQPISKYNRPPTCEVLPVDPLVPLAGQGFRSRVRITNPNPSPIYISSATYSLSNYNGDTDNRNGSAQGIPSSINARANPEFSSPQNIRVYDTSYDVNITWSITADSGSATCSLPNSNSTDRPDIILLPPICTIQHQDVVVGLAFTSVVSVTNVNPYAPIDILDAGTRVTLSNGTTATATGTTNDWTNGKIVIQANDLGSFKNEEPPQLIFLTAGDHRVSWVVNSEAGVAGGDCALGATGDNISAYTRPYVRFYGNDVFAGGEYGETCEVSGNANAEAYGVFAGSPSHATYKGAASELAVFAIGSITAVLPGSQDTARPRSSSLGFANNGLTSGYNFGGSFGSPLCADDYWAERPKDTASPELDHVNGATGVQVVDVNALANDSYYYSGPLHLVTSGEIAEGTRVTIYVEGDVWIGDESYTGNDSQSIAYNPGPWSDTSKIPIVRVISLGNIYIDNNINQLDGIYVAIPKNGDATSGEIHTCALSETAGDLRTGALDIGTVGAQCARQLVVNGAFIAQRVHLLRVFGNMGTAQVGAEPATSGNIAEVFRYSPEIYMALIGIGKGAAAAEFDGIITLPPAL